MIILERLFFVYSISIMVSRTPSFWILVYKHKKQKITPHQIVRALKQFEPEIRFLVSFFTTCVSTKTKFQKIPFTCTSSQIKKPYMTLLLKLNIVTFQKKISQSLRRKFPLLNFQLQFLKSCVL